MARALKSLLQDFGKTLTQPSAKEHRSISDGSV